MWTNPRARVGEVTVIDVELFTVTNAAGVVPKFTDDPATNPVPVIVTDVPPVVGPVFLLNPVTVGPPDEELDSTMVVLAMVMGGLD